MYHHVMKPESDLSAAELYELAGGGTWLADEIQLARSRLGAAVPTKSPCLRGSPWSTRWFGSWKAWAMETPSSRRCSPASATSAERRGSAPAYDEPAYAVPSEYNLPF
jgi:hypothetical protein